MRKLRTSKHRILLAVLVLVLVIAAFSAVQYVRSNFHNYITLPLHPGFNRIADMHDARLYHTATRLKNGQVLVAGGQGHRPETCFTAELFDPKTRKFIKNPYPMHACHIDDQAVLLPNGHVLITGETVWERYNPTTQKFDTVTPLNTPRKYFGITVLQNGNILITGGSTDNKRVSTLASAEIYDPITNTVRKTGNLNIPRKDHTATLLANGKVFIVGGLTPNTQRKLSRPATEIELYDPVTETFKRIGELPLLKDERFLFGNILFTAALDDNNLIVLNLSRDYRKIKEKVFNGFRVTRYNLEKNTYAQKTFLLNRDTLYTAFAPLTTGKILLINGGLLEDTNKAFLLLDPKTLAFIGKKEFKKVRSYTQATVLTNGHILITGGGEVNTGYSSELLIPTNSAEVYVPYERQ